MPYFKSLWFYRCLGPPSIYVPVNLNAFGGQSPLKGTYLAPNYLGCHTLLVIQEIS
jgi:hypothetical protein